jgi:hypothetical protein
MLLRVRRVSQVTLLRSLGNSRLEQDQSEPNSATLQLGLHWP